MVSDTIGLAAAAAAAPAAAAARVVWATAADMARKMELPGAFTRAPMLSRGAGRLGRGSCWAAALELWVRPDGGAMPGGHEGVMAACTSGGSVSEMHSAGGYHRMNMVSYHMNMVS